MEDTTTNYSTIIISVLMAVVIIATVMIPIITATTEKVITTEIDNEGAEWLKLGYNAGNDYSFNVGYETVTVDDVETQIFKVGDQIGEFGDMIYYADAKRVIFSDEKSIYLLNTDESSTLYSFEDTVTVTNSNGVFSIIDGESEVFSGSSPNWAYIPNEDGNYGFFKDAGLTLAPNMPNVAIARPFAGVSAYNDFVISPNGYDLGLVKTGDYSGNEVQWIKPVEEETEDTTLNITPINSGSGIGLMAVPTPSYTDGDWGFDVKNGYAVIVSYSGSAGDIVMPSTVTNGSNTYIVKELGKGGYNQTIFNNSDITGSTIVLPDTVTKINEHAFRSCSGFVGNLTIPESVTEIEDNAFYACTGFTSLVLPKHIEVIRAGFGTCNNLTGSLVLGDSIRIIGSGAFSNCSKLTGTLVIPDTVTSIQTSSFNNMGISSLIYLSSATPGANTFLQNANLKEVLNLSSVEFTTTSYGLTADSVSDHLNALGYIAPVSIHETVIVEDTSLSATLLKLLPVFMVLAVVIFIAYAMYRPDSEFVQSLKNKL